MSESKVVSGKTPFELLPEVKRLIADGWKVKGTTKHDAETGLYTQEMAKG